MNTSHLIKSYKNAKFYFLVMKNNFFEFYKICFLMFDLFIANS